MAVDWGAILGALAQYWGSRGDAGDTPNFYNVPMTPEDKAWNDRRMALYDNGGSEQMKAVGSAAQQFFAGMPTTANPTYASPFMQGQPFAGGIQLPKIDLSKFDFSARPPGATGTSTPPPVDGGSGPIIGPGGAPSSGEGMDYSGRPFGNGPVNGPSASEYWNRFTDWWARYRQENPDWKTKGLKAVLNAAAGLFGGPLASMFFKAVFAGGNENPDDAAMARFEKLWTLPEGQASPFGSAYGRNERPPGMGGVKPAPGVGVGGSSAYNQFGAPGSIGRPGAPMEYPEGRRTIFNPRPPISGGGVFEPGRPTGTPFDDFGKPGSATGPQGGPPEGWDKRDDYDDFNGFKMPGWYDPRRELAGGVAQPPTITGGGRFRNWAYHE